MDTIICAILAILLSLTTLQAMFFYFGMLKVRFIEWVFVNPCSISNLVFLVGSLVFLLSGSWMIMYIAALPLFFFGTQGLFIFSWRGMNLIPQASHLLMTISLLWMIIRSLQQGHFLEATAGLLISILIFTPFIAAQQAYIHKHHDRIQQLLQPETWLKPA
ncbi:hypothetical protein EPA93_01285 [Ktedonosporobacter rubrisoli]|uniref:Uncharacterized protein n=1 Tax=Ktedonosporobacter rubrisoli TaxID=2509675 RepID=A0A4P6JI21_KTERU|nr:hypothetical protein [Ktedonosporobacter rubrisoli]QBD74694.1 hypothetical protein EPA93_01285 [Ktedonosporobacter rubrisoli]